MNRRKFLKSAAALLALGALEGCQARKITEQIMEEERKSMQETGKMTTRNLGHIGADISLLGYGLMRLPQKEGTREIDLEKGQELVDAALKAGVNYFDTAWVYHGGKSETFAAAALKRHPRESYYLADKLPVWDVHSEEDAERIFNEQLSRCGVDYFDFFLLHSLNGGAWPGVRDNGSLSYSKKMKAAGKIRRLGFSFHGDPKDLETICSEEQWDFAQIQVNYFDWDDYAREEYEILTRHGIPVIVMEPLRGGELARPTKEIAALMTGARPGSTPAEWSFRYVASLPNVLTILSGMTYASDLEENLRTFSPAVPLSDSEREVIARVLHEMKEVGLVPCTGCRYCMPCPAGVQIPDIFKTYNDFRKGLRYWDAQNRFRHLENNGTAEACVECGACLKKCPQKIDIPRELKRVHKEIMSFK